MLPPPPTQQTNSRHRVVQRLQTAVHPPHLPTTRPSVIVLPRTSLPYNFSDARVCARLRGRCRRGRCRATARPTGATCATASRVLIVRCAAGARRLPGTLALYPRTLAL